MSTAPLICHIVYRLDFGGLENGLVNLINRLPAGEFRHAVIALTEVTEFSRRITRPDVSVHALGKRPGKDPLFYFRLLALLRRLRPALVHTRNLGTLDCQLIAWAARVPVRIHGEHGWDVHDPQGRTPRYVRLRRFMDRFVHRYVALSEEIETWLADAIGIDRNRVVRICNGVDSDRFAPAPAAGCRPRLTVGSIMRFSPIKEPGAVVDAFARLLESWGDRRPRPRLVMIGDGPLMPHVRQLVREAAIDADVVLPGAQDDVLPWLQGMDIFVLASRREGISNTILEAMACGLPVVTTRTGGNPELVEDQVTGELVPVGDADALGQALGRMACDSGARQRAGDLGRQRVLERFSLNAMVERYARLYGNELRSHS